MSQITVENIKRSTETASRSTRGVAAAWVNFDGTGTVAIRDSENVSSITDGGTGQYTSNFSNNMSNANYSILWFGGFDGSSYGIGIANVKTASAVQVKSNSNTFTAQDTDGGNKSIHGDLA